MSAVRFVDVTKRYPDGALAVDKISMDIADGDIPVSCLLTAASSLSDWSLADPAMERRVAFGQAALHGMNRLTAWQGCRRHRFDPARVDAGRSTLSYRVSRAKIRFTFQANVTRLHSPRTLSSPRSRNWRKPRTDLMTPNTGSGVCFRRA